MNLYAITYLGGLISSSVTVITAKGENIRQATVEAEKELDRYFKKYEIVSVVKIRSED